MTKQQLERLLDKACEIISRFEDTGLVVDEESKADIEAFFAEVMHSDELDADMEAQDYDVFGDRKI
jgi:hypothetical protein